MKKKLQLYISIIFILLTNIIFAQDYSDYVIDKNNTITLCNITQIKNGKIKYKTQAQSYNISKPITKFSEVKFRNPDVIINPLGLKIEQPEQGYSHVYFYFSEITYRVRYDRKRLTKISVGSYYLHKVKSGETHIYSTAGNNLTIEAEDQKTYLVRGARGTSFLSEGLSALVLDDRKVSEYAFLSMSKIAKSY